MIEIYNEKIQDLLNPKNMDLPVRETRDKDVYIDGLKDLFGKFDEVRLLQFIC